MASTSELFSDCTNGIRCACDEAASHEPVSHNGGQPSDRKVSFSLLGLIGFCLSIVSPWSALAGVLVIGLRSGGPPVMIWGWLAISIGTGIVALCMAEMASALPVNGGQYVWTTALASRSIARELGYLCGWFNIIGIVSMGAVTSVLAAQFTLGAIYLNQPFDIQRWHIGLLAFAIIAIVLMLNVTISRHLNKLAKLAMFWDLALFGITVVTVLATSARRNSVSMVFVELQRTASGFNRPYTVLLGLLQLGFAMCCYDAPAHLAEELKDGHKTAPRAIIVAVCLASVTGFVFLVVICFCIQDVQTAAASPTGVPYIQVLLDCTHSRVATTVLASGVGVINFNASVGLAAEAGRVISAFARDGGLPIVLTRLREAGGAPVLALCLTVAVQIALTTVYFITTSGFETVVAVATEGFYISYAIPLIARLTALCGPARADKRPHGPFQLGRLSTPLTVLGLAFLTFMIAVFNFPISAPVTGSNMNYAVVIISIATLTNYVVWLTSARHSFYTTTA